MDALAHFGPATRAWFEGAFASPTAVQIGGWARIAAGEHTLLLAPTGSGKTLAAFLWTLDRLFGAAERGAGVRTLYVSPLKALAYDVERNLRAPRIGIERVAQRLGLDLVPPRVAIRSGDTSQKERRVWAREPTEILVTTPESLYLILTSRARDTLRSVDTVIVDEVHALAPTKRGAHLALSLERLSCLTARDPQRIGLSATATPVEDVAHYLGGDRAVAIVDEAAPPSIDLKVVVPVLDMTRPDRRREGGALVAVDEVEHAAALEGADDAPKQHGIWPLIVPALLDAIRAHRTTIVFVNSRAMCERLVQRICELAGEPLVRAHHGSLSQVHRREAEELLKTGKISGIVATSSLELGIDMGLVDLVLMVESPGAVARGLQRVGRAGHGVGQVSKGRLFPKHRADLLEATVVAGRMREGKLEPLRLPQNPLDVLAQQVVAMCARDDCDVTEVERVVRRSASFAALPRDAFIGVLDMLSGRYPSTDFAELRPRLVWDRDADKLSARRGARMLAVVSGGTIPDRGLYAVYLGVDGARVGELDEEMVHETQPGHVITLGASSWRVQEITRDRVIVSPAPGEVGRMPFWRGQGPGRPIELGRALGVFVRELEARLDDDDVASWLIADHCLDSLAADNLLRFAREQREQAGALPSDRAIVVERFRDELGDHRICILSPFGARVHAPWSIALQAQLRAHSDVEVQTMYSDDGICLRIVDADEVPDLPSLFPDPEDVEELVTKELGGSALFATHFRENAARALLLPRRRPGARTPLWQQRLKSQQLLNVAREFPSFPIVVETYRECLQDVFDMPSLAALLAQIRSREVAIHEVVTSSPSPFARSLSFAFVAAYLYEGDAPLAERRAQALSLDRNLLRELLGHEELRELLDPEVIADIERELGQLTDERKVRHVDGMHDLLRRLGTLTHEEIAARCEGDAAAMQAELLAARRVVRMTIGGVEGLVAVEDAALYRDALGAVPPHGVPDALLEPVERALEALVARWARTHGPFSIVALATRHGLGRASIAPVLRQLEADDRVVHGSFRREGEQAEGEQWCDSEVLRRIKRRTLAKLRGEVEPVERATFARFLPAWHGVTRPGSGISRLEEALIQLEGMPLSFDALQRSILPARVRDFRAPMLDELGAMGTLVWVGLGALGPGDGKVALFRRDRVAKLVDPPQLPDDVSPLARALHELLARRGACFFTEIDAAMKAEGVTTRDEILVAVWDLVWAGLLTNDTFQPLCSLSMRKPTSSGRRRGSDMRTAGRWSLVAQLVGDGVSPTERAHARALMLLERHGIVSRDAAAMEALVGGFSGVYPVLRSMEEAGKLRRGYFVDGIGGAQFAFAGAVDRLRAMRGAREPEVTLLSAADPANAYGCILPWPEPTSSESRQPKRHAGAWLVLVDGVAVAYFDRGAALITFAEADRAQLERGLSALAQRLAERSKKAVRIDEIDGLPALRSPLASLLKELGLTFDHRGMIIERKV